jgi:hypothetical protein
MGGKFARWFWLLGITVLAATGEAGLCKKESPDGPLPHAVCLFPFCPNGGDCFPPTVDPSSVFVDYDEPYIQWHDKCPDDEITGACWDVYVRTRFRLTATGPLGVAAIGAQVKQLVEDREMVTKLWSDEARGNPERFKDLAPMAPLVPRLGPSVVEKRPLDDPSTPPLNLPPLPGPPPTAVSPPPTTVVNPPSDKKNVPTTIEMVKDVLARVPPGQRLELWVSQVCARDSRANAGCIPAPKLLVGAGGAPGGKL